MAKVFTITQGLENLGALKSGGQGSVYKGRRTGEIFTAIKILPTPISSESDEDKNFISFRNEVQKLKKVNESPNPNVVSIIDSGITDTGNFPYIEMDYIEGPDLAELLQPPHAPVFTIKEAIKVADHLSNALAHCHRADVKHGDIKSNNVKFNKKTGNYLLLDFGLSVMSDEQRRSSMRHAGAIEFMAPEQSAGETYFETDIYSFGIILFELIAGTVPFPLKNKGEMSRNAVMVAHMEVPPPDMLPLRMQSLPEDWSSDRKKRELQVPGWMLRMIRKCLEKIPANRFKNGTELQDYIHSCIAAEEIKANLEVPPAVVIPVDDSQWKKKIIHLEERSAEKDNLIAELQEEVLQRDRELYQYRYANDHGYSKKTGVSKGLFLLVLFVALGFAGYNAYDIYVKPYTGVKTDTSGNVKSRLTESIDSVLNQKTKAGRKTKSRFKKPAVTPANNNNTDSKGKSGSFQSPATPLMDNGDKYMVINTAYLYDQPDEKSIRDEFVSADKDIFTALREEDNFIYVRFLNSEGIPTRAWLMKNELSRVYE